MAHQDTRVPDFRKFNTTNIYGNLDKFLEKVKSLKQKAVVIIRGLPGTGKTKLANSLKEYGEVFHMKDYLPTPSVTVAEDGTETQRVVYTIDNMRKAHLSMRHDINRLVTNPKFNKPIIVSAPHVYVWELKYYSAIANQNSCPFVIYECRTLFAKDSTKRAEQLNEFNINDMISQQIQWLTKYKSMSPLLSAQDELLKYLTMPNAAKKLASIKSKNNSFCPNVLLNIQLAAWLTHQCEIPLYMDTVWQFMDEWHEITSQREFYQCRTPRWGW
jgi:hypothetical protein